MMMSDREKIRALEMEGLRRMSCCDMAMHNRLFGIKDLINKYFDKMPKYGNMVEIGSYEGVSTEYFSLFFDKVFAIDPFLSCYNQETKEMLDGAEPAFKKVLESRDNILHIRLTSVEGMAKFEPESMELVYLDGNHGEQSVMDDIASALRILKPGAILAGHDYAMIYTINGINKMIGKPDHLYSDTSWSWRKR